MKTGRVPAVSESGVPGFDTTNWFGIVAPAGTPSTVVARVAAGIREATGVVDVQKRMATLGFNLNFRTADEFRETIAREHQKYGAIIRDAGIVPDDPASAHAPITASRMMAPYF